MRGFLSGTVACLNCSQAPAVPVTLQLPIGVCNNCFRLACSTHGTFNQHTWLFWCVTCLPLYVGSRGGGGSGRPPGDDDGGTQAVSGRRRRWLLQRQFPGWFRESAPHAEPFGPVAVPLGQIATLWHRERTGERWQVTGPEVPALLGLTLWGADLEPGHLPDVDLAEMGPVLGPNPLVAGALVARRLGVLVTDPRGRWRQVRPVDDQVRREIRALAATVFPDETGGSSGTPQSSVPQSGPQGGSDRARHRLEEFFSRDDHPWRVEQPGDGPATEPPPVATT